MSGYKVPKDSWDQVYEISTSHLDDHLLVFNDAMMIMSVLGECLQEYFILY
jgi:hypothetical protein